MWPSLYILVTDPQAHPWSIEEAVRAQLRLCVCVRTSLCRILARLALSSHQHRGSLWIALYTTVNRPRKAQSHGPLCSPPDGRKEGVLSRVKCGPIPLDLHCLLTEMIAFKRSSSVMRQRPLTLNGICQRSPSEEEVANLNNGHGITNQC